MQMENDDKAVINSIKQNTRASRPSGDESFIKNIEDLLERRFMTLPRGRPLKKK